MYFSLVIKRAKGKEGDGGFAILLEVEEKDNWAHT